MFEFRFVTPRMDADTGADGGGDQGAAQSAPAPQAPAPQADRFGRTGVNPLSQWATAEQGPAPQGPAQPAPTVEELDFAGRRVPVVDPVIRDIHRDYSHLQRTFQETNQTMKTLQDQNQMFADIIRGFQQGQGQAQPQAQAEAEPQAPSQEDIDSLMNEWYENPRGLIQKIVQESMKPVLEPIQKERQYTEQAQALGQKYGDFQSMVPAMQQVIQANPQWAEQQSLETIFLLARGQQPTPQAPTMEQMLTDPNVRQHLLSDESLRNEFVSKYMQGAQQRNQSIPPVMGDAPGGNTPMAPDQKPKTVREATKGFARSWIGMG